MIEDVQELYRRGIRLTPEAYELLLKGKVAQALIERIITSGETVIGKELLDGFSAENEKIPDQPTVNRSPTFKPVAKEYAPDFKVINRSDVSGKSDCTGKLDDFVAHFRNRFERISALLRTRVTPNAIVKSAKLKETQGSKVRLIAMVTQKKVTKKGNLFLDVEDEEGAAKVVIPKDAPAFKDAKRLLNDDIIALDGRNADELFICENIEWPDVRVAREQKKSENDVAIAYISDLHFGSKKFLENEFSQFISWLNGTEGREELAGKVKYLMIAGDAVDGIGVYPSQEKELAVKDIYKQYEMLAEALEKVPDYITVIICPGNHDAVRKAEPQPIIPYDMFRTEVTRVGNPSKLEIEGLKHLMYHGTSLDSIISGISGLSYDRPEEAMLELVKRRHLSPIYGDNLIVPESRDYLVVDDEPDIVHMGHVHKNGYMLYRGVRLINSGTFQDRTEFQVRMGHVPTPGVVPVLETKSGKMTNLGFKQA
ncbi:MAG: DNA-directed DNA polymerase II small subunit [Candidatus Micrarchaeota archaeon]|nr:DNA-directed DNA polymerase II small subunit [Candidatus Micrarchaeota archaeon]